MQNGRCEVHTIGIFCFLEEGNCHSEEKIGSMY